MERPLSDDVARPVRAYLAALVPDDEVSDAWHELVADVTYWGDRQLLPVLRLAHQVVLQHERVAPEVATLVLVEAGIEDPAAVATVLDADEDTARGWTEVALSSRDGDETPSGRFTAPSRARPPRGRGPVAEPPAAEPPAAEPPAAEPPAAEPSAAEPSGASPGDDDPASSDDTRGAVRIGFDDHEPLPDLEVGDDQRVTARGIVLAVLALLVVLVAIWVLAR